MCLQIFCKTTQDSAKTMPLVQEKDRPTESSEPNIADGKSSGPASMAPETEAGDKPFPFLGLLCYADALDWLLMVSGTMGSFIHGMGPSMSYYILGKSVDVIGNNIGNKEATIHELNKVTFDLICFKANILNAIGFC